MKKNELTPSTGQLSPIWHDAYPAPDAGEGRLVLDLADDERLAAQLSRLYFAAERASAKIVLFGFALMAAEKALSPDTCQRGTTKKHGRRKGNSFEGWLAEKCPMISLRSAHRYLQIARALADKYAIEEPAQIIDAESVTAIETRNKILEEVRDKSMKSIQLELGLGDSSTPPEEGEKLPLSKGKMGATPLCENQRSVPSPAELAREHGWSDADKRNYADMLAIAAGNADALSRRSKYQHERLSDAQRAALAKATPAALTECEAGALKPGRALPGLFGKVASQAGRADANHRANIRKALISLRFSLPEWDSIPEDELIGIPELWQDVLKVLPGRLLYLVEERFSAPSKRDR
jgi:hypothetical protein